MHNIVPLILAAGNSSRIGFPKALLPLGKDTFLTRILQTLRSVDLAEARVVLGAHEPQIRPLLARHRVQVLVNPDPSRGQIYSIQLAAGNIHTVAAGCLIWPVDHPLVTAGLLEDLVALFEDTAAPLAMPRCGGQAGHPAIFGRNLIAELLAAPPGANPKDIVARHGTDAAWLPTTERGTIEDVDTPEDYYRLTGEKLQPALERQKIRKDSSTR